MCILLELVVAIPLRGRSSKKQLMKSVRLGRGSLNISISLVSL